MNKPEPNPQGSAAAPRLPKTVTMPLTVIVERQDVAHKWADARWRPVAVEPRESDLAPWTEIAREPGLVRFSAGTAYLTLHKSETDAYLENRTSRSPAVYVVLTRTSDPDLPCPYRVRLVSVSGYAIQDYLGAEEDIIEPVPMPDGVRRLVDAFIAEQHVETPFKKRKRDRLKPEEQKFGKEPIFSTGKAPHDR